MSKEEPAGHPPPYSGYTPDDNVYPPQNQTFPSQNQAYPPQNQAYAPQNQAYPPQYNTGAPPGYANPSQPGYPQQPYGAQQVGYNNATTIVVTQPAVALIQTFREGSVRTKCPHCQAEVLTATHYETGTLTWVICCVLFLFGCVLCCCLLPFCIDGCRDVVHTCPNCRQHIARFNRM